jgi:hypothetical protein
MAFHEFQSGCRRGLPEVFQAELQLVGIGELLPWK